MQQTEANVVQNNNVWITVGSSKVAGINGPGTGFFIKGTAAFITSGPDFDIIKAKFNWARAALAITILSATQTL
jgi:hypothetical protein